jgi:hypothetical protein
MKKTIVVGMVLLAALPLGACDYFDGTHEAHTAVRGRLTDPGSAQFANDKSYAGGTVCGEVNSKSQAGDATGFLRYVYANRLVFQSAGDPDFAAYYRAVDGHGDFAGALDQVGKACVFASTWTNYCTVQKDAEQRAMHQCSLFSNRTLADTNTLRAEVGAPPAAH